MPLVLSHGGRVGFAADRAFELALDVLAGVLALAFEVLRMNLRLELSVAVLGWDWVSWIATSLRLPPPPSSSSSWWIHRWNSVAERDPAHGRFAVHHSVPRIFGALYPID